MTLLKCTECDGAISSLAQSCPHCGAPGGGSQQQESEKRILSYLLLHLLLPLTGASELYAGNILNGLFAFLAIGAIVASPFMGELGPNVAVGLGVALTLIWLGRLYLAIAGLIKDGNDQRIQKWT